MKNCTEYLEQISAYVDNELNASDQQRIEEHLSSCEACSDLVAMYREISNGVAQSSLPAPEALRAGVMSKIRSENTTPLDARSRRRKLIRVSLTRFLPIAACLAIALLVLPRFLDINRLANDTSMNTEPSTPVPVTMELAADMAIADADVWPLQASGTGELDEEGNYFITGGNLSDNMLQQDESGNDGAEGRINENAPIPSTEPVSPVSEPIDPHEASATADSMSPDMPEPPMDFADNGDIFEFPPQPMPSGQEDQDVPIDGELVEEMEMEVADSPDTAQMYYAYITIRGALPGSIPVIERTGTIVYITRESAIELINEHESIIISIEPGDENAEVAEIQVT